MFEEHKKVKYFATSENQNEKNENGMPSFLTKEQL